MDLASIKELAADYGVWFYIITFLWTFIEGETFVIYAGVLAAQGILNAPLLIACAWLGSFCGDQCYFTAGRLLGHRLLARFPAFERRVARVDSWLKRHEAVAILSFRWIYGVRNVASVALGMTTIPWHRFLALNFLAAGLWALGFFGSGYVLGQVLRPVIEQVAPYFSLFMLGFLALMFGAMALVHRRQARRAAARAPEASAAE